VGGGLQTLRRGGALVLLALGLAGLASAAAPARGRPIVVPGCDGVYYERDGSPRVLIVSDFPLETSTYTATHQIAQAIKLTLKDRSFHAGAFTVGYVVCDDSGPAGSSSAARCRANARAASRVADVVAMIGTLDSGCARVELPVLADAHVLLVSPLNTATDLTHLRTGAIARMSATDDKQAAAAASFLHQDGVRTVAVLSDGTPRGNAYRAAFFSAAHAAGLRTPARGQADAAYVGGLLSRGSGALLREAKRRVPGGPLVLAAGYGPAAQLVTEAGPVADGAYLVVAGVPVERLGEAGRDFVTHFATAIGRSPHPYAVYAAQAANLLLDAIARSNGTRRSVGRIVLATKVERGLTGTFAFDANGDATPAAVTIFRVRDGRTEIVRVLNSGIP
jgi:branched-chain amino acid transport system substrate-binding protein